MSDNFAEIVSALACGARIVVEGDGFHGNDYELRTPAPRMQAGQFDRLMREGWLESAPNGASYVLSDRGRKAYLRSTDELGDGKLELTKTSEDQP
jgi:hypothetical protein